MRIIIVAFFSILISITGFSQNDILKTPIEIKPDGKSLKQIIVETNQKYLVSFSYSDNILPKGKIHGFKSYYQLDDLLDNIFVTRNIGYKLVNGQIVLYKIAAPVKWVFLYGFLIDSLNSESIINGSVFIKDMCIGGISNAYGYFSVKVPAGIHPFNFSSLGYKPIDTVFKLFRDTLIIMRLAPKSYQMNEVVVNPQKDNFIESALNRSSRLDISTLREMPGVFGESDALRNLDLLPGLQTSEISTSNICVRGGSSDQTVFLMDEANVYNASHFGGFSSVFNPDVVNHVSIFKSDIPINEGGALSSILDVRLRDGNMQQWSTTGSIGLLTARALIEGPIVKDRSSLLIAFRRTYADQVLRLINSSELIKLKFYFYDGNFKFNYKIDPKNRIYISGYTGSDMFDNSIYLKRSNSMVSMRWNHTFGSHLFCNVTSIGSYTGMVLSNFYYNEAFRWRSKCWDGRIKIDFSNYVNDRIKLNYGYSGTFYSMEPFELVPIKDTSAFISLRNPSQPVNLNSIYINENYYPVQNVSIQMGVRLTGYTGATDYQSKSDSTICYVEPNMLVSWQLSEKSMVKAGFSYHVQPIHQLQVSSYGIAVNRWMPSNNRFLPEKSYNYTVGYYWQINSSLNLSSDVYYRKMKNLIETMQEMRLIYEKDPERFLFHSSGKVFGIEVNASLQLQKIKAFISYDYTHSRWKTNGLNGNRYYPASFIREHSFNISTIYKYSKRTNLSASWQFASGTPYTAAIGKYVVDGKTVLQFDNNQINTKNLPAYHRLDLSIEIAGKKNDLHRWKSYWNFSVYNAYFRKNPLGVVYFTTNDNKTQTSLNPGFYYFYQFVPSATYRFRF